MNADTAFLDANVFVRSSVQTMALHVPISQYVAQLRAAGVQLWISRQVLRESLVTLTREQGDGPRLKMPQALALLYRLEPQFYIADETPDVTMELYQLLTEVRVGGKQVHDANIVATMLAYNIPTLVTLNTADMRRFAPRVDVVSPVEPTA